MGSSTRSITATTLRKFIITSDFNIHLERALSEFLKRFLPTPPAFDTPLGVTLVKFCSDFYRQKTRILGCCMKLLA